MQGVYFLKPEGGNDAAAATRAIRDLKDLVREADMLAHVHHVNIVSLFGIVVDEATHAPKFVVEELATDDLRAYCDKLGRPLGLPEFKAMFAQLLLGMEYLHSKAGLPRIARREIKPENILVFVAVDGQVTVKLSDVGTPRSTEAIDDAVLTVGSPYYTAPEVFHGQYTDRADMFSLGTVMTEVLVRYILSPGGRQQAQFRPELRQHWVDHAVAYLRSHDEAVIGDLLVRCCSEYFSDRPSSTAACHSLGLLSSHAL